MNTPLPQHEIPIKFVQPVPAVFLTIFCSVVILSEIIRYCTYKVHIVRTNVMICSGNASLVYNTIAEGITRDYIINIIILHIQYTYKKSLSELKVLI